MFLSVITLNQITKAYQVGSGEQLVLKGIDLAIEQGDLVAIMGESGSGKSTLMNIIGLLDRPSSGSYKLNDNEVAELDNDTRAQTRGHTIGFVFQSFFLLPRLTIIQNVGLPLRYRNMETDDIDQRCLNMLAKVGIDHLANQKPHQLSGGQQQRVAIARALVGDPTIILADEPTGALDTNTSQEVMDIFLNLNRQEKRTIILITHDPRIGEQCQRRILLKDGLVEQD